MSNHQISSLCPLPNTTSNVIRLGHGSGGKMTANLIESLFLPRLGNDILNQLDDASVVSVDGTSLAVTIDSYVVSPIFFPGGDIGSLAVHGTINDLSMRGARPLFLTATFIIEEGLSLDDLSKVTESLGQACVDSEIQLVAADTKVVNKGAADKLFVTTCGIGLIDRQPIPAANRACIGDYILLSGDIGRHGTAIICSRAELELETDIVSDTAPLHNVIQDMLDTSNNSGSIHCLRDITRGGLASVLNELAQASQVSIIIDEEAIPVHPQVSAVCELFGLDPLYVACEGRFVAIAHPDYVDELLVAMKKHSLAEGACIIGEVTNDQRKQVMLRSKIGGHRILDKLSGEQLPRIC